MVIKLFYKNFEVEYTISQLGLFNGHNKSGCHVSHCIRPTDEVDIGDFTHHITGNVFYLHSDSKKITTESAYKGVSVVSLGTLEKNIESHFLIIKGLIDALEGNVRTIESVSEELTTRYSRIQTVVHVPAGVIPYNDEEVETTLDGELQEPNGVDTGRFRLW